LARNKTGSSPSRRGGGEGFRNRSNEILFIDARELGTMISRKQRELTDKDIAKIADTYHHWRGKEYHEQYKDLPGFCKSATIEDVRRNNYILTPGRYIDFKEAEEDGQAFEEKMQQLTATLKEQMQKANALDEVIKLNLHKIGFKI
jgi:type I restriction enzyme M protein